MKKTYFSPSIELTNIMLTASLLVGSAGITVADPNDGIQGGGNLNLP